MIYELGQIIEFTNELPDDLLEYLDANKYYLVEIEPIDDVRRAIIAELSKPTAEENKAEFESKFFEIEGVGYYRKQPKGYQSAVESINTAFNMVTILGLLPANTLTFYTAPDFADAEQCTEEWLIDNSFKNEVMTAQEFGEFYAKFMTAWNTQEHK
ncbi:MAG: hypothetical protein E7Z87_08145 [Cyanobacteria bacterium SIG26]|nr:hypothetical protein [Cyanobacteria bacterium SIG26]